MASTNAVRIATIRLQNLISHHWNVLLDIVSTWDLARQFYLLRQSLPAKVRFIDVQ